VCNAGVARNAPAEEMTLEAWNAVISVNLTGVFFSAQACARAMIEQRAGSIVMIASMSGLIVNVPQQQAAYNISKAGVIMATKSLAVEWARYGIRVNAIAPGYMKTAMTAAYLADPQLGGKWMELTPMKRPGEPHELGGAVVYLASDASSFVTGHTLVVDGGYVAP
jgi:NAD(P)-dependent dehydrogenase (short-subunit alcohol dehydrogenase family)